MMLVRSNGIERAVRVSNRRAQVVTKGPVVTGLIIPPGAVGFRARGDDIIGRAVLSGRKQNARIEALDFGRLIP